MCICGRVTSEIKIRNENVADINTLIKVVIVYVGKKICFKACGSKNKKESD